MRKFFNAALAVLLVSTIVMPPSAHARGRGVAVAAGIIGGLAAGALAGSVLAGQNRSFEDEERPVYRPRYYGDDSYAAPPPYGYVYTERRWYPEYDPYFGY